MKLRKLIIGILLSIVIFNFSGIEVYAAEGTDESQINNTNELTTDGQDGAVTSQSITADSQEGTTADPSVTTDNQDATTTSQSITADSQEVTAEAEEATIEDEKADSEAVTATTEVKESKPVKKAKTEKKVAEVKYTKSELRLLSALVFCEAQSESYNGKLAVAIVVMNRVRSNLFPDTLKGVIYQKYQFSPARNGSLKRALAEYDNGKFTSSLEKDCIKAAKAALSGEKSITVKGKEKNFSKYLYFSGWLKGHTFELQNHQFK